MDPWRALAVRVDRARTYRASLRSPTAWPPRRFVVLTRGRAGSTLLGSLLDAHPAIRCDDEILMVRRRAPLRFVDGRAARAGATVDAFGFKLLAHQLWQTMGLSDPRPFMAELHRRGYRVVRLRRDNPLHGALSYQHSLRDRSKHHGDRGAYAYRAMDVDVAKVLEWLRGEDETRAYEDLAVEGLDVLDLVYEDDLLEPTAQQRTVDRCCAWLGVRPQAVSSDLVKLMPRRVHDMVRNYDELAAALQGTPYRDYLD